MQPQINKFDVLLMAPATDLHAVAVRWVLEYSGVSVMVSSAFGDGGLGRLSLECGTDQHWCYGRGSRLGEFNSIWYRRPKRWPDLSSARECDRECMKTEWRLAHENLREISAMMCEALWINSPAAAVRADNKLLQLDVARRCALPIPSTLVSNETQEIKAFLELHHDVIHKTFIPHVWKSHESGEMHASWASRLRPEDLEHDESIALCPGIFQAYVNKQSDIRVVVIGDKMFPFEIRYADGTIPVDWRKDSSFTELDIQPIKLPEKYVKKLRLMMNRLDLVYGSIDLVLSRDGDLVFLEVNQAGEFLFAEKFCPEIPLLRSMASMLIHGGVDYSMEQTADLGLSDFIASDTHQQLLEAAYESPSEQSIRRAYVE
ncbi:MAG: hypothetical protein WD397_13295 [Wenzhouxiangellaceae bacterium]